MCVCAKESAAKRYNLKSIDIAILREREREGPAIWKLPHCANTFQRVKEMKKTTKLEDPNIEHDGIKRRRREEKC